MAGAPIGLAIGFTHRIVAASLFFVLRVTHLVACALVDWIGRAGVRARVRHVWRFLCRANDGERRQHRKKNDDAQPGSHLSVTFQPFEDPAQTDHCDHEDRQGNHCSP